MLRAGRVLAPTRLLRDGFLGLDLDGTCTAEVRVCARAPPGAVDDLFDPLHDPGFVDLHVHGGEEAQITCAESDCIERSVHTIAAGQRRADVPTCRLTRSFSYALPGLVRSLISGSVLAPPYPFARWSLLPRPGALESRPGLMVTG